MIVMVMTILMMIFMALDDENTQIEIDKYQLVAKVFDPKVNDHKSLQIILFYRLELNRNRFSIEISN